MWSSLFFFLVLATSISASYLDVLHSGSVFISPCSSQDSACASTDPILLLTQTPPNTHCLRRRIPPSQQHENSTRQSHLQSQPDKTSQGYRRSPLSAYRTLSRESATAISDLKLSYLPSLSRWTNSKPTLPSRYIAARAPSRLRPVDVRIQERSGAGALTSLISMERQASITEYFLWMRTVASRSGKSSSPSSSPICGPKNRMNPKTLIKCTLAALFSVFLFFFIKL